MTGSSPKSFTLKGWHVLAGFIAFFSVGIAVNIVFITQAITTFRGEEVERSYMQGLAFNEVLEDRREQAALGWQAAVNLEDGRVLVSIRDGDGNPIQGLDIEARLRHPADLNQDRVLTFDTGEAGLYSAPVEDLPDGRWVLALITRDGPPFAMESEIWQRSP